MLRVAGDTLALTPPLIVSEDQIGEIVEKVGKVDPRGGLTPRASPHAAIRSRIRRAAASARTTNRRRGPSPHLSAARVEQWCQRLPRVAPKEH